jgi:small GTP-binding protein
MMFTEDYISEHDEELMFKFVLLGDAEVGKTSFVRRILGHRFRSVYHKTIGVDISHLERELPDGRNILITLWDLAGDEHFRRMRQFFFQGTTGVFLVIDVTKEFDYESLMSWFVDIDDGMASKINIALIGNKIDLDDDRIITSDFVKGTEMILQDQVSAAASITSFEVSAKNGKGCSQALDWMIGRAIQQIKLREEIINKVFADNNVLAAMFKLTEYGPDIMYHDFDSLPYDLDVNTFLMNMTVSLVSAIGQGHNYSEGIFDLPSGKLKGYRSCVFSFRMSDYQAKDVRLKWGFFQFVLFVPEDSYKYFEPFSKIESCLRDFITEIKKIENLSLLVFKEMKLIALEEFAKLVEPSKF